MQRSIVRWGWLVVLLLAACAPTPVPEAIETPASDTVIAPGGTATTPAEAPVQLPTPTAAPVQPTATPGVVVHTVQAGDSLWGLAARYDVPIAAIQLQNGMGESTALQAGQVVTIPPAAAWEGAATFWVVHEAAYGETLSEIAAIYDIETARLREVNGMDAADPLVEGQALVLPLDAPADVAHALPATATPEPSLTPVPTFTPLPPLGPTATPEAEDAPAATPTLAPTPLPDAPPADPAAWPRAIFDAINQVRAAHGLPPYIYNETLALAAQRHANDCSQRGSCSHTGSDGSDIQTRIERVGYEGTGAECWAAQDTPQGAVDVWMDEVPPNDPHRRMMLHTWFTEVGIGLAPAPWDGYYYIIADFGHPTP